MTELKSWIDQFKDKLDESTGEFIYETLVANQFFTRLQLKLLSEEQVKIMFPSLALGAKSLLLYQLDLLKEESPLPGRQSKTKKTTESERCATESPQARRNVLPALSVQQKRLQDQLDGERQDARELEMNIESMNITIPEPPAIGNSKVVCSFCHHRGHRNQQTNPCKLKKCTDYTFCGMKDRHPEYVSKLNVLKTDLRKKKKIIEELEAQLKSMEDFTSNNDYHFVKALTPRLYAVDPSYKLNKPKLMRDVRLLKQYLDGKIPKVTSNDPEQLRILISKCKKNVIGKADAPDIFTSQEFNVLSSPVKTVGGEENTETVDSSSSESNYRPVKRRSRKHKTRGKNKRQKYRRYSSSDDSDDSCMSSSREIPQSPRFPAVGQFCNPQMGAYNPSYNVPFYAGMQAHALFQQEPSQGHTPMQQFYHPRMPFYFPPPQFPFSQQFYQEAIPKTETITRIESDPLSTLADIASRVTDPNNNITDHQN